MADIYSRHLLTTMLGFFQSRNAAITFQLTPAIYLAELKYVIKINSLLETRPKDIIDIMSGSYITDYVNVLYSGKYVYYTTKPYYLTLCMFPSE
jgi:hypothetical protein